MSLPVKWQEFGSPEAPADIGGSALQGQYVKNCESVYRGREVQLDKGVFYQDETAWTEAGGVAPQSIEELRLLENDATLYDEYKGNLVIFELGPGDFTKTKILLENIAANPSVFSIRYIAIDINKSTLLELRRLDRTFPTITMHSLHGNCDQALQFVSKWKYNTEFIHIWCLGSGPLSNAPDETVVQNIAKWSQVGQIMLGQSTTQSATDYRAYEDNEAFVEWIERGLRYGDALLTQSTGDEITFFTSAQRTIEYSCRDGFVQVSVVYKALKRSMIVFRAYQKSPSRMLRIADMANCTMIFAELSKPQNGSMIYKIKAKRADGKAEESNGNIQFPLWEFGTQPQSSCGYQAFGSTFGNT